MSSHWWWAWLALAPFQDHTAVFWSVTDFNAASCILCVMTFTQMFCLFFFSFHFKLKEFCSSNFEILPGAVRVQHWSTSSTYLTLFFFLWSEKHFNNFSAYLLCCCCCCCIDPVIQVSTPCGISYVVFLHFVLSFQLMLSARPENKSLINKMKKSSMSSYQSAFLKTCSDSCWFCLFRFFFPFANFRIYKSGFFALLAQHHWF